MKFNGKLYRALNPIYAHEPMSGHGAALFGGRFNPRGMPALYVTLSIVTAVRESNQAGSLQPTTLVSYHGDFEKIFDARDPAALASYGMDAAGLADPAWRDQMKASGKSRTQLFAEALAADGYQGMLVPSFATGSDGQDLNIVLWSWSDQPPGQLTLIDDEGSLAP